MEIKECRDLAEKIVAEFNPEGLSPFPYQKIEEKNKDLKIFLSNIEDNNISGAITYDKETPEFVILINKNKPPSRQYFTVAHELGHYFLHKDILREEEILVDNDNILEGRTLFRLDTTKSTIIETEANNFGASLIMPENQVYKAWNELKNIEECAKVFNVSVLAMTIRLTKLNLVQE